MSHAVQVRVAVVYHSGYRHTQKQAEAVAAGAAANGAETQLISVDGIDSWRPALEAADAIIFGSPTYMGSASGAFKMFMDANSHRAFAGARWKDKLAALASTRADLSPA